MKTSVVLSVVLVLVLTIANGHPLLQRCPGRAADVVFVLDTSTSVWASNFNHYVRPFVRDVVRMFDVGPGASQTRVGVVTYSDEYHPQIDLGDHLSHDSLEHAIDNIVFTGGSTFTNKVLDYVAEDMFSPQHGARREAFPVIILVTDGRSRFPVLTAVEADQARAKGMHIFAVGVGQDVDNRELRAIANDPDHQFVFHVRDFKALHSIHQLLVKSTCDVLPDLPFLSTTESPLGDHDAIEYCAGKPADIYFLLDVSSSVWRKNFNTKVLPFVRDMVSVFDIGKMKTRVGLVTFSTTINPVFSLNHHTSRDQLMRSLTPEKVRYTGGRTFTSSAIAYVRDTGFSPSIARKGVAQVMILITDGISYEPALTASESAEAKRRGIYIFSIGVGPSVDYKELSDVSSDPDADFVFHVTDFSALSSIKDILAIETCKVLPTDKPLADINICNMGPTDMYFVFESFSKSAETRVKFRSSVIQLVNDTVMRNSGVRISAITDPCVDDLSIPFTTLLDFRLRFGSLSVLPRTDLHGLIGYLQLEAAESKTTGPARRSQVGVIFVDAATEDLAAVVMNARQAQAAGVELFVVAVGNLPSRTVDAIGSSPARDHVIVIDSYDNIDQLSDRLGKKIC